MADILAMKAVVHEPAVGVLQDENDEDADLIDWSAKLFGKWICCVCIDSCGKSVAH